MLKYANWIHTQNHIGDNCPLYRKKFNISKKVSSAVLKISARGVYEAHINKKRVGNFILAPGWTAYEDRIQVQEYDVTDLLNDNENSLIIQVAPGWYTGGIARWWSFCENHVCAVIAQIEINYTDGTQDIYCTAPDWEAAKSGLTFCEIYDGFRFDARIEPEFSLKTVIAKNNDKTVLIPQQGEEVCEHERFSPIEIIHTPRGETVLDFGQNLTGYIELNIKAKCGDQVLLSFAEILDKDGNFYNENYRSAKCEYNYICRDGWQTFKPTLTFYGFRYVRVDQFPSEINCENFTAIVVHSNIKRKGWIETSDPMLNKLFHNIIWGQKSNFLDVPTDCPQRDERMGWTGDAQIFVRTASYNFEVEKFFDKWLEDLKINQCENGAVPMTVPNYRNFINSDWEGLVSSAWADAVTICPWQIYLTYGNKDILRKMYEPMKKWVDYITSVTEKPNLWFGGRHFGDWLELKATYGKRKGETRDELISSAFYARSTEILCKVGDLINEDVAAYKQLHKNIRKAFIKEFKEDFKTQTEHVLPLYFGLTDEPQKVAESLANMIHADGDKLQTGFVGTPYLLHVLSQNGYTELAYKLLLRKEFPSWLYPITKGATTMWEHWDGIMPNGDLWPVHMNSYNHYAYGAVGDWLYGACGGINTVEEEPGFKKVHFAPVATDRIDWFRAEINTAYGKIKSGWYHKEGKIVYEITTPVNATAVIDGKTYELTAGEYTF